MEEPFPGGSEHHRANHQSGFSSAHCGWCDAGRLWVHRPALDLAFATSDRRESTHEPYWAPEKVGQYGAGHRGVHSPWKSSARTFRKSYCSRIFLGSLKKLQTYYLSPFGRNNRGPPDLLSEYRESRFDACCGAS